MSTLTDDALTRLLEDAARRHPVPDDGPAQVLQALEVAPTVLPLRRRRSVQLVAAAAVVVAAFAGGALLQGDEGATSVTQQAAPSPSAPAEDVAAADEEAMAGGFERQSADRLAELDSPQLATGLAPAAASAPGALPPTADQSDAAAAQAPAPGVQAPAPDGARIVKNGSIGLIVSDGRVTPTLTAVQELATAAGGVVQSAQTQESGLTPSGSVVLRVPVDTFEQVVSQVRTLDAEVRAATTSGRDVTSEYTDVEAQLRSLRAARERFLEILSGARSIGDVLTVQQRIDETTGQIDRLEGQRALLQAQSDSATLEVTVTEADDPAIERPDDDGLGKAFRDAWEGFTSGVEALVAASGRALLLLLCLVAVLVVGRLGWRASRRRLV
jgi:hypothetical protein